MRQPITIATIILLSLLSPTRAADLPVEQSLVVKDQGYFPVALRLNDNRIAVVLRGGAPHLGLAGRLDILFSSDQGKTWTQPTTVIDSPLDDRNPAFGQAPDGALVVAFWRTARYDESGRYNPKLDKPVTTWLTRSTDSGKTWSDPKPIDVTDIAWGSPYGRILTLPDNSMLMNIYGGRIRKPGETLREADDTENNAYIYRSTDHGQSWTRFAHPGPKRFNETALLALPDNRLLAAMRSAGSKANVWLTSSSDMGKTWTEPKEATPPNVHPADVTRLPDGRILLTAGDRRNPFGLRALLLNPDGSPPDFSHHLTLTTDATNTDCGYPSTLLLPDNRLLTLYYAIGSKSHPDWKTHAAALTYTIPSRQPTP